MKMSKSKLFEIIYEQNKYFNKIYESNKKDDDVSYEDWERLYNKYEILTNKYLTEIKDKIKMLKHILYIKLYFANKLTMNHQ